MKIYSYEEVLKNSIEYFEGDELAATIWIKKYALKDKNENLLEKFPEDMHLRIARELVRIESKYPNPIPEEEIFGMLKKFKYFIPAGSPMFGIGNNSSLSSLSNCYVVGNNDSSDSYGSIMRTDEEIAQIYKRRGGCGISLDHYRPTGALANGSELKDDAGATLYMERFSHTTKEVAQSGRRGALMETISINHPDAEKFVDKKVDTTKVTGANISIKLTDDFMDAVMNEKDFIQTFPIDLCIEDHTGFQDSLERGEIKYNKLYSLEYKNDSNEEYKGCYAKKVNAKKLWNKIILNAWKSAEPGLLYWDKILKESPAGSYGKDWKELSTNPCFSGKEKLLTINGEKTFEELEGKNIKIYNEDGDVSESKVWCSGIKETIKISNTLSESFICTPEHIWKNVDGKEVEAKNLVGDRLMPLLVKPKDNQELYVKLGFIQGDGNLTRLNSESHLGLEVNIGKDDNDILEYFNLVRKKEKDRSFYVTDFNIICNDLKFDSKVLPERCLPKTINDWSKSQKKDFLRGLYSANGSVIKNTRVSFKSTCLPLIKEIKDLLNELDIESYFTTNKSKKVKFNNGEYLCKESYDLNIGKFNSIVKFYNEINFIHKYKTEKLKDLILKKSPKITKIEKNGEIKVYDFTEPKKHWGVVNGYIAHNCAELPLCPYDSCRLSSLNLLSYVEDKFTENALFNFELFKSHVNIAQRFMDDIIDLEIEKLDKIISKVESDSEPSDIKMTELWLWEKIKNKAIQGRRTGLGITAEGDMLAALGLRYGSPEAIEFAEEVHKTLAIESYKSSIEMAKERGAFPIWEFAKETQNPFIKRVYKNLSKENQKKYTLYGRRNIANLTIAPNGSVSLMTQTTSGVEPLFAPYYKRRRKVESSDKIAFVDEMGDKWEEYAVFHKGFSEWFKIAYKDFLKEKGITVEEYLLNCSDEEIDTYYKISPYYKSTANDINWTDSVKMQGTIQKWIDHSISKTVNVPKKTTKETIGEIYLEAYKSGCKGVTVYRDGCRDGVLITGKINKEDDSVFKPVEAHKRPKKVECDIFYPTINKSDYIVFVGLLNGFPYEVFAFKYKENNINKKQVKGIIERVKSGSYQLLNLKEEVIIEDLSKCFETPEEEDRTRLISCSLSNRTDIKKVVEQLNKSKGSLIDFSKVIARQLKRYIKDGEESGEMCPECGQAKLVYQEGCLICRNCGYSKCG